MKSKVHDDDSKHSLKIVIMLFTNIKSHFIIQEKILLNLKDHKKSVVS